MLTTLTLRVHFGRGASALAASVVEFSFRGEV